jgi:hypothetical protein
MQNRLRRKRKRENDAKDVCLSGARVSQGNPDNLHAIMEAAKEYGKY